MSTAPRSRRKPPRSLVPYGNRVEEGLLVRAAIPADFLDVLDVLDVLFAVSSKPAPDAKAINRGLLPYVTRLANLGPVRDGFEMEIAERQAHHVWKQLEPVVRLEAADDLEGGGPSVPQALFDVVMRGLVVGTFVGAGGPHAIRRYLRRFNLLIQAGEPGRGDAEAQKVRDRFSEQSRIKGYGRSDLDLAAARLVVLLAERSAGREPAALIGVGKPEGAQPVQADGRSLAARQADDGVGRWRTGAGEGAGLAEMLPDGVYAEGRVRRVVIKGCSLPLRRRPLGGARIRDARAASFWRQGLEAW